jgi:hypothetical protein
MEERGRLQICTRPPDEIAFDWRRFYFFEIEKMVAYAIHHGELGLNVYMEGRTLQASTKKRGKLPRNLRHVRVGDRFRQRQRQGIT